LRLTIELEPVRPFVRLRHVRFSEPAACFAAMAELCTQRTYEGHTVEFSTARSSVPVSST